MYILELEGDARQRPNIYTLTRSHVHLAALAEMLCFVASARKVGSEQPERHVASLLGLWISVDLLFFCDEDIHSQSKISARIKDNAKTFEP
jgi:hypothetical protein